MHESKEYFHILLNGSFRQLQLLADVCKADKTKSILVQDASHVYIKMLFFLTFRYK